MQVQIARRGNPSTSMGCVSTKLFKRETHRDILVNNGGEFASHVVSLTSTTYGAIILDDNNVSDPKHQPIKDIVAESKRSPPREEPEVINARELMEDLEDGAPTSGLAKKSPKSLGILRGLADLDTKSPPKFLNQFDSPKKARRFGGKENKGCENGVNKSARESYFTPKSSSKGKNSPANSRNAMSRLSFPLKGSPLGTRTGGFGNDSGYIFRRRSLSPLFDRGLVASYERELFEEEEQIKRIISPSPGIRKAKKNTRDLEPFLCQFEQNCPPGGENAVVLYTTTLRGIRKTFEDCNCVRSIIESHQIQFYERDVSMDSGFKEELRSLTGTKEVKVPLVFVKGRLIGGVDQVVKLEEEGKLGILFDGIAKAVAGGCEGCAGVRFVMCRECNGSCKVLDHEQKKTSRCGECNENGLIHCPVCF